MSGYMYWGDKTECDAIKRMMNKCKFNTREFRRYNDMYLGKCMKRPGNITRSKLI